MNFTDDYETFLVNNRVGMSRYSRDVGNCAPAIEIKSGSEETIKTLDNEYPVSETATIDELRKALNHYRAVNVSLRREVEALRDLILGE